MFRTASLMMVALLMVLAAPFASGQETPAAGEKPAPQTLQVLAPNGEVAVGATVFIGTEPTLTLVGSGSQIQPLTRPGGVMQFGDTRGANDSFPSVVVAKENGDGIDLSKVPQLQMGMDAGYGGGMGMGMEAGYGGGMGGMGMGGVAPSSLFYYAIHPQHGFAFVPPTRRAPRAIRLRKPAALQVSVPRQYDPQQYAILACWMNRYADPICAHRLPSETEMGDAYGMGMDSGMMEMMGGYGGGGPVMLPPADPAATTDPLQGRFQDWRLKTIVTHWSLVDIQSSADQSNAHTATVNLPPGEVRITLVPKSQANDASGNVGELERMLYFAGPSQLELLLERGSDDPQTTNLPSQAVHDIELVGRPSVSGIPNWTEEQNSLLLTEFSSRTSQSPGGISERGVIEMAEKQRAARSSAFLGRLAFKIGEDRYRAIGVPPGIYVVSVVSPAELPELASKVKACRRDALVESLQSLSVRGLNSTGTRQNRTDADRRPLYQLLPPSSSADGETLIDLALSASADNPGAVAPQVIKRADLMRANEQAGMMDMGMPMGGMDEGMMDMSMGMGSAPRGSIASAPPTPPTPPAMRRATQLDALQQRIERLERDLNRAKALMQKLTPQTTPAPALDPN